MASKVVDEAKRAQCAEEFAQRQLAMLKENYSFSGHERDLVALNLGDGRYLDISGVSGADSITDGRGAVYADFDNDGDTDIFLRAMHGPAHLLYRNNIGHEQGFVRVALEGRASGRDAFGAVVRLKTSAGVLTKVKAGGSGYLSQCDPRILFGLGDDARAEWMEVTWPGGRRQRYAGPQRGETVLLIEGRPKPIPVREQRFGFAAPR